MSTDLPRTVITPVAGRGIPADTWAAYRAGVRDGMTCSDVATVLDALSVAAGHYRDRADICGDCTGYPDGELCGNCQTWLRLADACDELADRIRSGQ